MPTALHTSIWVDQSRICSAFTDSRPRIGGAKFQIVGKQLKILIFLARRKDQVVSKEMLLDHLYPDGIEPDVKIIDVFICKLRKKLKMAMMETGGTLTIETVWGRGYVLRDERSPEDSAPF